MFKYLVIKNAVSFELANFIFNYFLLKRDAVKFMYDNNIVYDTGMLGTWSDQQVPNTYSHYADMVMETLMMKVLPRMEKETGLKLLPTYSYARLYKKGEPPKHLWREVRVNPMVGRIIMFPAWLWHCVDPNNTNDIRISVSFNFIQKGFNV